LPNSVHASSLSIMPHVEMFDQDIHEREDG
jgi:hypothetical protein